MRGAARLSRRCNERQRGHQDNRLPPPAARALTEQGQRSWRRRRCTHLAVGHRRRLAARRPAARCLSRTLRCLAVLGLRRLLHHQEVIVLERGGHGADSRRRRAALHSLSCGLPVSRLWRTRGERRRGGWGGDVGGEPKLRADAEVARKKRGQVANVGVARHVLRPVGRRLRPGGDEEG